MRKEGKVEPLRGFLNVPSTIYRVSTHVQCWSLFHFLMHGEKGRYRKGLMKYLAGISAGKAGDAEFFEKSVGKIELLEVQYRDYVRTLAPDTTTR